MKVEYDFFKIESKLKLQKGRILLSEPFLPGNYFSRSAVLIADYSAEGAVGFILNKPIDQPEKGIEQLFSGKVPPVYVGGPVNTDNLYYIHTLGNVIGGSVRIKENLYWGGDFDQLSDMIKLGSITNEQVRFFIGYSGWSPGQLEHEIAENSWLLIEANSQRIMVSNDHFWAESVRNMGGRYEAWPNFPEDPNLN